MSTTRCPCLTGLPYDECCGPLHAGRTQAATPEQLMRSRFSAYAVQDGAYVLRTWHPRTRPAELDLDGGLRWYRLDVLAARGTSSDVRGQVEFVAYYRSPDGPGQQRELSRFVREGDRWFYLDAVG